MHLDRGLRHQRQVAVGRAGIEHPRKFGPQLCPLTAWPRHEGIEAPPVKYGRVTGRDAPLRLEGRQVEDQVTDRDTHTPVARVLGKHAEGQVLDREIAIGRVGAFDPAPPGRIVGFVENRACHGAAASRPPSAAP